MEIYTTTSYKKYAEKLAELEKFGAKIIDKSNETEMVKKIDWSCHGFMDYDFKPGYESKTTYRIAYEPSERMLKAERADREGVLKTERVDRIAAEIGRRIMEVAARSEQDF